MTRYNINFLNMGIVLGGKIPVKLTEVRYIPLPAPGLEDEPDAKPLH